ncbi:MAG TPA: sigma-54 dependent transcriptional regulator [Thermoanaerobaculia bacterium]
MLAFPEGESVPEIHALEWERVALEALDARPEPVIVAIAAPDARASAAFFARLAADGIRHPVLAIVRAGDAAMTAAVAHADDFALWPAGTDEITHRIERLLSVASPSQRDVRDRLGEELALAQLVGEDQRFLDAIHALPRFARSGMPVLIAGETGTGKELCARAVHFLSARRSEPFVAVDCSAIPDHLFENELFGHARGAYTDAHIEQKGLVALAGRGTLFLDEVDSLSLAAQGKLLRFLQEKTYKPLGSEKFVPAQATVLAATNAELETLVREKRFRSDLYYRLNVLQLRLPPLRDRRDDIPLLARHFLATAASRMKVDRTFSPQALRKLTTYDWPGNVRELWNLVQRAAVQCDGGVIRPYDIEIPGTEAEHDNETFRTARTRAIQMFERTYLQTMLARHAGNISRAAREAGQERRAFGKLVKKYRLGAGGREAR